MIFVLDQLITACLQMVDAISQPQVLLIMSHTIFSHKKNIIGLCMKRKKNSPSTRSTCRMKALGGNMVILWTIQMENLSLYIIIIFIFGVLFFAIILTKSVVVPSMVMHL